MTRMEVEDAFRLVLNEYPCAHRDSQEFLDALVDAAVKPYADEWVNVDGCTVSWDADSMGLEFLDIVGKCIGAYEFTPEQVVVLRDFLNRALDEREKKYGGKE